MGVAIPETRVPAPSEGFSSEVPLQDNIGQQACMPTVAIPKWVHLNYAVMDHHREFVRPDTLVILHGVFVQLNQVRADVWDG
jgi:hypothetical protein